jgi:V-type H+-transporting ATPase subunit E
MVAFIIQEAQEKCKEIKLKTDTEFNLEKSTLIHNGKIKVNEEYAQKEKDLQSAQRVSASASTATARVRKMKDRDDLLQKLKGEILAKLAKVCKSDAYPALLKKLIVQGLIKIEEPEVEVAVRPEDKAIVMRVLPEAIQEYRAAMAAAGHTNVNPRVSVSDTPLTNTAGGVKLTALQNKIVLDQTVEERAHIAYTDLAPQIREGLFGKLTKK